MIFYFLVYFLLVGFLFFCVLANSANLPSLLAIEREDTTNHSIIAKYSWDPSGKFTREVLFSVGTTITASSYSQKNQTLFLFYHTDYDHIGIYDLKNGNRSNYVILDTMTSESVLGSVYIDDTDELWIWFTDPVITNSAWFTTILLYTCDIRCSMSYYYRLLPLDPVVLPEYTHAGRMVYFSDENRGSLWSWDFDKQQLLIGSRGVGSGPAYNMKDGFLYSLWYEDVASVYLRSFDPIEKSYISYKNLFPNYALSLRECLAAFVDDYYITTIQSDHYMLVFAPPGGDNIYQVVDNKVMWFWKWQDSLDIGKVY